MSGRGVGGARRRPRLEPGRRSGAPARRRVVGHLAPVRGSSVIRSPAIGAATSPPRPPCSTRTAIATFGVVGRGEPDEPRVRLAGAAELGRARLAGRRHARDLGARRELPPERPSTAWTIAALIAWASAGEMTRPIDCGPIVRVPLRLPVIGGDEARLHQLAVVRHGRRDERHLERRHERLAPGRRPRWPARRRP